MMKFTKMHGCGNDYVFIFCFDEEVYDPEMLSVRLSDRHTGIGSDGLVLIQRSDTADAMMRMYNSDGSEGLMCGNAIRCVAKYLYDNKIVCKTAMRIGTMSGTRRLWLTIEGGAVASVKVDMGRAGLNPESIPVKLPGDSVIAQPVNISGIEYAITCVSMGNPHAVVFISNPGAGSGNRETTAANTSYNLDGSDKRSPDSLDSLDSPDIPDSLSSPNNSDNLDSPDSLDSLDGLDLHAIGPLFEFDSLFPDRVNVTFATATGRNKLRARVWERGSGETLACGTGACAVAVAAVLNGLCDKGEDIEVNLPGGVLSIRYTDETVYLTGDCVKVFDGVVEI